MIKPSRPQTACIVTMISSTTMMIPSLSRPYDNQDKRFRLNSTTKFLFNFSGDQLCAAVDVLPHLSRTSGLVHFIKIIDITTETNENP